MQTRAVPCFLRRIVEGILWPRCVPKIEATLSEHVLCAAALLKEYNLKFIAPPPPELLQSHIDILVRWCNIMRSTWIKSKKSSLIQYLRQTISNVLQEVLKNAFICSGVAIKLRPNYVFYMSCCLL